MPDAVPSGDEAAPRDDKRDELHAFIFLAVVLFPAFAIALVGGWGFVVWMTQLIVGPPTG